MKIIKNAFSNVFHRSPSQNPDELGQFCINFNLLFNINNFIQTAQLLLGILM